MVSESGPGEPDRSRARASYPPSYYNFHRNCFFFAVLLILVSLPGGSLDLLSFFKISEAPGSADLINSVVRWGLVAATIYSAAAFFVEWQAFARSDWLDAETINEALRRDLDATLAPARESVSRLSSGIAEAEQTLRRSEDIQREATIGYVRSTYSQVFNEIEESSNNLVVEVNRWRESLLEANSGGKSSPVDGVDEAISKFKGVTKGLNKRYHADPPGEVLSEIREFAAQVASLAAMIPSLKSMTDLKPNLPRRLQAALNRDRRLRWLRVYGIGVVPPLLTGLIALLAFLWFRLL